MNIIALGDIHGDIENLFILLDKISLFDFDVIVYSGDFIDTGIIKKGFKHEEIAEIILEELLSLNKPLVAIPGNHDKEIIKVLEEKEVSIHCNGKIINNFGFYGFGGARTPFNTPFEPSEEEIYEGLKYGFEKVKNAKEKIQVTHMPPANTKVDIISSGAHVGSEKIRNFIEKNKPLVAISAHIHEARGIDELNETKIINPGRFPEGYCGFISIEDKKINTKIVNLI